MGPQVKSQIPQPQPWKKQSRKLRKLLIMTIQKSQGKCIIITSHLTVTSSSVFCLFFSKSAHELSQLKKLRLGFQNIGPTVSNLEPMTGAETIVLSGNYIEYISVDSFTTNVNLQYLSLSRNKLVRVKHLVHLNRLEALDLSNNDIESVEMSELPPNLLSLKLNDNPIEQRA